MCGRFTLFTDRDELKSRFQLVNLDDIGYQARYNIAPSQSVVAVVNDGKNNKAGMLRWGLIPSWAKDPKIGYKLINARGETVHEKPAFKKLIKRRRCIIIADSFYEWKKEDGKKTPMRIHLKTGEPFSMAGLWDRWQSPDGEEVTSCTVITTTPNELMADIHDRMPVILNHEGEQMWLDRTIEDPQRLTQLLVSYDARHMDAHEVSNAVNSPRNDVPQCIEPA